MLQSSSGAHHFQTWIIIALVSPVCQGLQSPEAMLMVDRVVPETPVTTSPELDLVHSPAQPPQQTAPDWEQGWSLLRHTENPEIIREFMSDYPTLRSMGQLKLKMLADQKAKAHGQVVKSQEASSSAQATPQPGQRTFGGTYTPDWAAQKVESPRLGFAPGSSDFAIGVNRFDESRGIESVFKWTYFGYTAGVQPDAQSKAITPQGGFETPDQIALTIPAGVCQSTSGATTEIVSSADDLKLTSSKTSSWDVSGGYNNKKGSFKRGSSSDSMTYQKAVSEGESTMAITEKKAKYFHLYLKDCTSLSSPFAFAVQKLNETYNSEFGQELCKGGRNSTDFLGCSKRAMARKELALKQNMRRFFYMFGTDFMAEASLGGIMKAVKTTSKSVATIEQKSEFKKSASMEFSAAVEKLPAKEANTNEAEKEKKDNKGDANSPDDVSTTSTADKATTGPAGAKAGGDTKSTTDQKAAPPDAKSAPLDAKSAKAAPPDAKSAPLDAKSAADQRGSVSRRLLQTTGSVGGAKSSTSGQSTSSTQSTTTTSEQATLQYYGCDAVSGDSDWCQSCRASPVAIDYRLLPLSLLVRTVLKNKQIADALDNFLASEYHPACLTGYTWNKMSGECVRSGKCPAGMFAQVPLETVSTPNNMTAGQWTGTCTCATGKKYLNVGDGGGGCSANAAEATTCVGGTFSNCSPCSPVDDMKKCPFGNSVTCGVETCPETGRKHDCSNPACSLEVACPSDKSLSKCACPLVDTAYEQCAAPGNRDWYSQVQNGQCNTPATQENRCVTVGPEYKFRCDQSGTWARCDSDGSWYGVSPDCNMIRVCAGNTPLSRDACPLAGIPCDDTGSRSDMCFSASTEKEIYQCESCPPGTFGAGGVSTECQKCPLGTFAQGGASMCTPCPVGNSSNPGSNSCTQPGGDYYIIIQLPQNAENQVKKGDLSIASAGKGDGNIPLGDNTNNRWAYWNSGAPLSDFQPTAKCQLEYMGNDVYQVSQVLSGVTYYLTFTPTERAGAQDYGGPNYETQPSWSGSSDAWYKRYNYINTGIYAIGACDTDCPQNTYVVSWTASSPQGVKILPSPGSPGTYFFSPSTNQAGRLTFEAGLDPKKECGKVINDDNLQCPWALVSEVRPEELMGEIILQRA